MLVANTILNNSQPAITHKPLQSTGNRHLPIRID